MAQLLDRARNRPRVVARGGCLPYAEQPPGTRLVCVVSLKNEGREPAQGVVVVVPKWVRHVWAKRAQGSPKWLDQQAISAAGQRVPLEGDLGAGGDRATLYAWGDGPLQQEGGFRIASSRAGDQRIKLATPIVEEEVFRPPLSVAELGGTPGSPTPPASAPKVIPPGRPSHGSQPVGPPVAESSPVTTGRLGAEVFVTASEATQVCFAPRPPSWPDKCFSTASTNALRVVPPGEYRIDLTRRSPKEGPKEAHRNLMLCCGESFVRYYNWASGQFEKPPE